jgi:hypothetical protein
MTPKEFCHWLQGYFEINGAKLKFASSEQALTSDQVEVIRKRLGELFEPVVVNVNQQTKIDEFRAVSSMIDMEQEQ